MSQVLQSSASFETMLQIMSRAPAMSEACRFSINLVACSLKL